MLLILGIFGVFYFWTELRNEVEMARWRKEQEQKNLSDIIRSRAWESTPQRKEDTRDGE